jgi:hypothetical protein
MVVRMAVIKGVGLGIWNDMLLCGMVLGWYGMVGAWSGDGMGFTIDPSGVPALPLGCRQKRRLPL